MTMAALVWGAPAWLVPATIAVAVMFIVVAWAYGRSASPAWVRLGAALLKVLGIVALAVCLVEPLFSGVRPRPGANLFLMLADNSQSLQVRDGGAGKTRAEWLQDELHEASNWQTRLSQDFDVRRYVFDTRLRPVAKFTELSFDGNGSSLAGALATVSLRYRGRPQAGILLFTDGNATDLGDGAVDWSQSPPVFPVVMGDEGPAKDISVARVSVSQASFEAAPVTILAEVACLGYAGKTIVIELLDESGKHIEKQTFTSAEDDRPLVHRFQLRPESRGISFYRVRAFAEGEEGQFERPRQSREATLVNNSRLAMVDRGGGPYRVLYVSGRPNWEFKFLRRAIEEDDEVSLVGMIRIAKREPKFTFRGHLGETTNPLYRGFDNQEDEGAEQYDEPVLLRLGVEEKEELRDGFPKDPQGLFRYHAIILDDVEAGFFAQDQMSLIQEFVSQRGGGLLMLGGRQSFAGGDYRRTPIGQLLPVYLDRLDESPREVTYQLALTRDGWLQPWVRLRSTEEAEKQRLDEMPLFKTVNRMGPIKPGASVLARVTAPDGTQYPALVVQRFGKGRVAAMLIADLWRWNLRRIRPESDLEKSWRQTVRWLVADIPQRIEVQSRRKENDPTLPVELTVQVRDERFQPLDNASVNIQVKTPDGKDIELTSDPSDDKAGDYVAAFVPRTPGAYRAKVVVTGADGSRVGERETGWTSEPATDEFRTLRPNRPLLERIAEQSGGEVIPAEGLYDFVTSLPNRKIPITEPWIYPLWHQWSVFLFAVSCLIGEWGLRRWNGLP